MRVLLDECIPRKLALSFVGHDCQTVARAGFAGMSNGRLLTSAEQAGFELLLTVDKGLQFQQNFTGRRISILLVRARSNELEDLLPHVPACLAAMLTIRPGEIIRVS